MVLVLEVLSQDTLAQARVVGPPLNASAAVVRATPSCLAARPIYVGRLEEIPVEIKILSVFLSAALFHWLFNN